MRVIAGASPIDLESFDSWDTFPPQRGRVWLWSSAEPDRSVVGDYRVVLSFGPDRGYTMAYAVPDYLAMGIPSIAAGISLATATDESADRAQAERAAVAAVDPARGEVLVWCDTLVLAVQGLEAAGPPPTVAGGDRLAALELAAPARSAHTDRPVDRPPTPDENRSLYETMSTMGLAEHLLETALFALVLDDEELELSRNLVEPADVDDLVRVYFLMPTWPQRCAIAYVAQDLDDPRLRDVWLDVLRAPARQEPLSLCHIAQASSLARLRGSIELVEDYLDDQELLAAHVAIWASLRSY